MSGTCFVCQRAPLAQLTFKGRPVCSFCAPHALAGEMMVDATEAEEDALMKGGEVAGEYLDAINKTDLATLTADEWRTFLCKVLAGYSDAMRAEVVTYPPF